MRGSRILCLGGGEGWHSDQLLKAADSRGCSLDFATYESLRGNVGKGDVRIETEAGPAADFDVVMTRTMPAGNLERVTFRLATLHALDDASSPVRIVNRPRSLEIAIDKFATLARVAGLGFRVPETVVVQSRGEAVDAFRELGGDVVVKPLFGGEGRGIMRIRDAELAWYTFSTLDNLGAVAYLQRFIPPGGRDTRVLVIGDEMRAIRRISDSDFRTNVSSGGRCESIEMTSDLQEMARRVCGDIGLRFAAVDLIDSDDGEPCVIEVNAIPGWKGAQQVTRESIAGMIVDMLQSEAQPETEQVENGAPQEAKASH